MQVKLKIIGLMEWYSYSFLIDSNPLSAGEPLVILDVHHSVLQVSVSLGQINLQDSTVRNKKYCNKKSQNHSCIKQWEFWKFEMCSLFALNLGWGGSQSGNSVQLFDISKSCCFMKLKHFLKNNWKDSIQNNDIASLPAAGFSTNLSDRKRNEKGSEPDRGQILVMDEPQTSRRCFKRSLSSGEKWFGYLF